ncbi:MAG TPA: EF-hand domain-containing protein [Steroidobacteraceae bacterium]|nr:EF-hand domain-containing protein [Steroidobacteraceae bacterium]
MRTSMMDKAVALLAAGLFSTALMAGDQHASTFESLDKNSDQQISKSEAQGDKMLSDSFASADSNGDGYLSKTEFKAASSATTPPSASRPSS